MSENKPNQRPVRNTRRPAGDASRPVRRKPTKKYQGYDVDRNVMVRKRRRKPWFWKILGISLVITAIILVAVSIGLLHHNEVNVKAIEEINEANNLEALLKDHKNVTITRFCSHLKEGQGYTTTRQVRKLESGEYFSYLKKEDSDDDYKEVINEGELYRNKEGFSYYYGLIGDDYKTQGIGSIEEDIYQGDSSDTIDNSKEREKTTTIKLIHEIKEGDDYSTLYGFEAGKEVEKVLTLDNETKIVTSEEERVDDEVFYSYSVEFDTKDKMPKFFSAIQKKKNKREVTVYSDYNGENGKKYSFKFPKDVYFMMFEHKGYKIYLDEDAKTEFSEFQIQTQNPESDLTLYVKPEEKKKK